MASSSCWAITTSIDPLTIKEMAGFVPPFFLFLRPISFDFLKNNHAMGHVLIHIRVIAFRHIPNGRAIDWIWRQVGQRLLLKFLAFAFWW
jgi:hypothetical protein